jgi:YfiH family protein
VPRQIHGTDVERVEPRYADGRGELPGRVRVVLAGRVDGLVVSTPGVLLASTAADCVPMSLVDPVARIIGLVHAGWRGAAAGILRRGVARVMEAGAERDRLLLHLGPAICGACYEVDRPLLEAFGVDAERGCLDLRGRLVHEALEAGLREANVTVSTLCTKCGPEDLHSHRGSGGEAGRMAAFTGFSRG